MSDNLSPGSDNDRERRAYKLAAKQLRSINIDVKDSKQVADRLGFSATSENLSKLRELLDTGVMRRLEEHRRHEEFTVRVELCAVHGVSGATAGEWYRKGIRSVDDAMDLMNDAQRVAAMHRHDLAQRIPRTEVAEIVATVQEALQCLGVTALATGAGSYRRGSPTSGDVDVLITRTDGGPEHTLLANLLSQLAHMGVTMEHLTCGSKSYSGVLRLPSGEDGAPRHFRRVDLKVFPQETYAYALLHFTSGAEYNVKLRTHANTLNLRLSEKGLFRKGIKSECNLFPARSEEDIFARLGLQYQEPWERFVEVRPIPPAGKALMP